MVKISMLTIISPTDYVWPTFTMGIHVYGQGHDQPYSAAHTFNWEIFIPCDLTQQLKYITLLSAQYLPHWYLGTHFLYAFRMIFPPVCFIKVITLVTNLFSNELIILPYMFCTYTFSYKWHSDATYFDR